MRGAITPLNQTYRIETTLALRADVKYNLTIYENWLSSPCFLVVKDDKIIGFSSTCYGDFGWTDEKFLSTFVTYVLPEHRKIGIVKALYNAIKKYAKLQGVLLIDAHLATERVDGRRRLLLSQGFEESGFLLTYKG